jgi:hypothetical protein
MSAIEMIPTIKNEDLVDRCFDEALLISNLGHLSRTEVIKTQRLSAAFCVRYLLRDDEPQVPLKVLLRFQKHLTLKDLFDEYRRLSSI